MQQTSRTHRSETEFRPDIEGMRAVAVLLVVAFHVGLPVAPGGFIGVDVFFVISGYLITGLLAAELRASDRINFLSFYARRTRRLLPAALLMVVATLIGTYLILSPLEQEGAAKAAATSSVYVSNLWFMRLAGDYFSPESALNPFLHTWSLSVEEQFYLVWPAMMVAAARFGGGVRALRIVFATVSVISFAACVWLAAVNQPWAFYLSPARAWEFGVGALASAAPVRGLLANRWMARAMGWGGLGLIIGSGMLLSESARFPGWNAVPVVLGTAAVLLCGTRAEGSGPYALLASVPMQVIGRLSYSFYLWHWPALVLGGALIPELSLLGRVACAAIAFVLAALSYFLFEHPIRRSRALIARPVLSVGLALALTLSGGAIGAGAFLLARDAGTAPAQAQITMAARETSALAGREPNCIIMFTEATPLACEFGPANAAQAIVLFGDSHAAQWFTPIRDMARARGARLVTFFKASCPIVDGPIYNIRLRRLNPECTAWRAAAIHRIIAMRPALVIVGNHQMGYVMGPGRSGRVQTMDSAQWAQGLQTALRPLGEAGLTVILLRDTPRIGLDVPTCLGRAMHHGLSVEACGRPRGIALDEPVFAREQAAARADPGVAVVDMTDAFCTPSFCPPIRAGLVVYRDANHVAEEFARRLGPELMRRILAAERDAGRS
jgi:peptidoglycan/LPS O-acetylase OafA/YrhL